MTGAEVAAELRAHEPPIRPEGPEPNPVIEGEPDLRIIEHKPRKQHHCRLPGWFARRQMDLGYGSIIECRQCGKRHRFDGSQWWQYYGDNDPKNGL